MERRLRTGVGDRGQLLQEAIETPPRFMLADAIENHNTDIPSLNRHSL
jgi:hypothetical protein